MMKKLLSAIISAFILVLSIYGFYVGDKKKGLSKISKNDDVQYIAVNECFMWISNNGMGSHNPITDDAGFYWPGGENATLSAIFADGLIWGAIIEGEIRVNGSTYRHGLQAGKILETFTADDPDNPRYRIYKIRKDWEVLPDGPTRRAYQKDYEEWPVEDGAPWIDLDGDGIFTKGIDEPEFLGDEMLWCVSNDLDPSRSTFVYGSLPIGLEIHTLVFGFSNTGDLGNMLFKKYKIINKGDYFLDSMYVGYWSDTDLGFAEDDYSGCDTLLNMGYTYNADNNDEDFYKTAPPALGYVLLQGPIIQYDPKNELIQRFNLPDSGIFNNNWEKGITNLPMTTFSFFINSWNFHPIPDFGATNMYNYLRGRAWNGDPLIDPITLDTITRGLAGNPIDKTGWYEGEGWPGGPVPGDRRHIVGSGPFSMAPGDSQEVTIGIVIAQGSDNIHSVAELKGSVEKSIILSENSFVTVPDVPLPKISVYSADTTITLYWETNVEDYDEVDKLIQNEGFEDITYNFEGYILRQYSDMNGSDEKIIASFDIKNDIDELLVKKKSKEYIYKEVFYELENKGLERKIIITRDSINSKRLNNNNPYYYSLSAFAVNENSEPMFIESKREVIEIFPGSTPTNVDTKGFDPPSYLVPELSEGFTNADIRFNVIDPLALTGDTYQVTFSNDNFDTLGYSLKNISTNTILLEGMRDIIFENVDLLGESYLENTSNKNITDGFILTIRDLAAEYIEKLRTRYAVWDVLEVKGPGGIILDEPVSVNSAISLNDTNLNSTGEWFVYPRGASGRYNWQGRKNQEGLGYDFYEIRFTEKGSDFFASGDNFGTPAVLVIKDDPKGIGKVPFEIWNVKQTLDDPSDDVRLIVKILDLNRSNESTTIKDGKWSQLPSGYWEEIYAYEDSLMDPDNLPEQSGTSDFLAHKFGALVIHGSQPTEGTVIRLVPALPLVEENVFEITMPKANLDSKEKAKEQLDKINVFPNPYYGTHNLEQSTNDKYVRFINLPRNATIRIFNLGGTFIQKIEKENNFDFADWDLRNQHGIFVASGLYIVYIDIPEVGNKILKVFLIMENN